MAERTVGSRRAYEGRLISLRVDEVELDSGRHAEREIVEHPGAVAILAWDGSRLAMVRQYRQAAAAELLEVPAGTLEDREEPRAAAQRELAEECGLAAESWEPGPAFYTAPGFCTERLNIFLAQGLRPADEPESGPDDEAITRAWLTLPEALAACDDGRIADAKSLVAIGWLARRVSP